MIKFLGKAETLISLKKVFKNNVPNLELFSTNKFLENKRKTYEKIKKNFKNKKIAVRSTYKNEDLKEYSNAGKYTSTLNIDVNNEDLLVSSILKTINSYESKKNSYFFIQEMVESVSLSGVCLTRSLNNVIPSFEINFSKGKETDVVTSGKSNVQNLIYFPNKKYSIKNKNFLKLIKIVKKLIKLFKNDQLDIEFAINKRNKVYLLQVRPIVQNRRYLKLHESKKILKSISKKIIKLQHSHHNLLGKTTFFSVMPDWNPAEIIGIKPNPLALSLYQELITNNVWSKNRNKFGFQDVDSSHLLTTFYGTPYVDVRVDFNSWIPSDLKEKTKEKLVNFYLNEFKRNKKSHDKVEFDILFTCFTPDSEKKIKQRLNKTFSKDEINKIIFQLKKITNNLIQSFKKEISLISNLKTKQDLIKKSNLYSIEKIYWLIQDCKKYGTDPFASLARCAFISIEILNSFVKKNIITQEEKNNFLSSIKTITSNILNDFSKMNKKSFLKLYGHLRPNTYDINSSNYRDGYKIYFSKTSKTNEVKYKKFKLEASQIKKIEKFLEKAKINLNFKNFVRFLKQSIEYREYAKFVFTKSIDLVFENLKIFGKRLNIDNRSLCYLKIQKILELHYNLDNSNYKKILNNEIKINKKEFDYNKKIKLPDIIISPKDLFINIEKESKINFVTTKNVSSKIVFLNKLNKDINNKIIIIENADPGYDFIFNKKIKGLITKFGGLNSHMAIRCAELSIPAAIGVGEIIYQQIKNKKYITLDCESQKIY